jgi:hypothetical protein
MSKIYEYLLLQKPHRHTYGLCIWETLIPGLPASRLKACNPLAITTMQEDAGRTLIANHHIHPNHQQQEQRYPQPIEEDHWEKAKSQTIDTRINRLDTPQEEDWGGDLQLHANRNNKESSVRSSSSKQEEMTTGTTGVNTGMGGYKQVLQGARVGNGYQQ